jgi:hypothetical protein
LTFTLWSRGRLLGETALDYQCPIPLMRAGDLCVTELGLRLLSRVTETRGDGLWAAHALNTDQDDGHAPEEERRRLLEVCADLSAAANYQQALELELRRPDGSVVPTERIDINDTEFLRAFGEAYEEEIDAIPGVERAFDEPPGRPPWTSEDDLFDELGIFESEPDLADTCDAPETARFQLMVTLDDGEVLPRA